MTFASLGLRETVLQSITNLGFEAPTPIQEKAIPHLLQEKSDFVGLAQTGTGKTAAFGLPLVHHITKQKNQPQALVICPTRELCLQITGDIESYAANDHHIEVVAVYGGADIRRQMRLVKTATIVVATPGRLRDLIKRNAIDLSQVGYVVLDEADEMLNMGFKEDIDGILDETPSTKNTWLFSATMPKEVAAIAKNYMTNPQEVSIGQKNQTNENISHIYYIVKQKDRYEALKRLLDLNPDIFGVIFCRTRRETQVVAEQLERDGYDAAALHGDLSQAQRDGVMNRFREHTLQILVATDVAARGIDIDDVTHVINYNLPDDIENYTHRSGRTARAGKKGKSLVIVNTREAKRIREIERMIKTTFEKKEIPSAREICDIQLTALIDNVLKVNVKEEDIKVFLPKIMDKFEDLSKEEIIKKFISVEFNKFIEYYDRAGNLNASEEREERGGRRGRGRDNDDFEPRGGRRDRKRDENSTRYFVNIGRRDGLNPGGLLRTICDTTGLTSSQVGRIDIMPAFSFFETDNKFESLVLNKTNGAKFEQSTLKVEITKKDASGHSAPKSRGPRKESSFREKGFSGKKGSFQHSRKSSKRIS